MSVFADTTAVDWTQVLLALVGIIPATVAAWFAYRLRIAIRTPSGAPIGTVAEQTHHLTSANTAMLQRVHEDTKNGGATPEGGETPPSG
jgi:hypothetical protein